MQRIPTTVYMPRRNMNTYDKLLLRIERQDNKAILSLLRSDTRFVNVSRSEFIRRAIRDALLGDPIFYDTIQDGNMNLSCPQL